MATVVFGGAGFVGLNLIEALLLKGKHVRCVDKTALPAAAEAAFSQLPGTLEMVTCDVTIPADVAHTLQGATDVFYGAAVTAGDARDSQMPETVLDVNLMGLLTVLRQARDHNVRRLINLSSTAAYGASAFGPDVLTEDLPAEPSTLYAVTKFASERVTSRMASLWSLDAVSVRLSGVFGRWERQTDVRDTPSPQHQLISAAQSGTPVVLSRRDARDWTYATDIAHALVGLMDAERLNHSLYNVSCGVSSSVLDFGEALKTQFEGFQCRTATPSEEPTINLYGMQERGILSIERLKEDTGFTPEFDVDNAAKDYVSWLAGPGATYP
ncbi:MAG: NAD(P)-dependent oxidoreductase [Pseudomonadota bacterium]